MTKKNQINYRNLNSIDNYSKFVNLQSSHEN
jgi:hypothetical protein